MNKTGKGYVFGCLFAMLTVGWLIFGHLLIIEGIGGYIIWLIPIAAVVSLKESGRLASGAAAVLIIMYILIGSFFGYNSANPVRTGYTGSDYCAVYEHDPGAMGRLSYRVIRYREIISCKAFGVKLLTVRVSFSSKTCRSLEGVPAFSDN